MLLTAPSKSCSVVFAEPLCPDGNAIFALMSLVLRGSTGHSQPLMFLKPVMRIRT
jgi:hypothetical protein